MGGQEMDTLLSFDAFIIVCTVRQRKDQKHDERGELIKMLKPNAKTTPAEIMLLIQSYFLCMSSEIIINKLMVLKDISVDFFLYLSFPNDRKYVLIPGSTAWLLKHFVVQQDKKIWSFRSPASSQQFSQTIWTKFFVGKTENYLTWTSYNVIKQENCLHTTVVSTGGQRWIMNLVY